MSQIQESAPGPRQGADPRGLLFAVAATALLTVTSVLIRLAAPLSPFGIGFGRLVVATATVWVLARFGGERPRLVARDLPVFALFGLVLAFNAAIYPAAVGFTTIPHALVLGAYSSPVFVTLLSSLILREPLARRKYVGIALTVAGAMVLVGFEPAMDGRMLVGDLLALAAGASFALYSIIGRSQRNRYPLFTYAIGVYGAAALWLLPAAVLTWSGSVSLEQVLAIVGLGVVALGLAHTLYAAALRRTHATLVNIISTQEVTGGILLGLLVVGEAPAPTTLVGGLITLVGVALVLI